MKATTMFLCLAPFLFSAPLSAQNSATIVAIPWISVTSRGELKVQPDRASIHVSVQTKASTAATASTENARKQKAVIDAIRALGVAAGDISTIGYNVYPEQRYQPDREPIITGYNVTNTVSVEVKTLSQVGPVIDAALAKGANMVTSLNFFSSNTDAARRDAIGLAIQKARSEAEAAARAAGGTLGELLEIGIGTYLPPPPRPMEMLQARAAIADQAATPINPGEQTLAVDVSTRWRFVGSAR